MFAQIVVHCSKEIDLQRFVGILPPGGNAQQLLAQTDLANTPLIRDAHYAARGVSWTMAIFPAGPNSFEAYVVNHGDSGSLAGLKASAHEVMRILQDTAKSRSHKVDDCTISISTNRRCIQSGKEEQWWKYVSAQFAEKMLGNLLAVLIPAVVAFITKVDLEKTGIALGAAVLAILLRVTFDAVSFKGGFKYADT